MMRIRGSAHSRMQTRAVDPFLSSMFTHMESPLFLDHRSSVMSSFSSFSLDMSSGDSVLAILIGLLGAFLLHLASKLLETSTPFHVSLTKGRPH